LINHFRPKVTKIKIKLHTEFDIKLQTKFLDLVELTSPNIFNLKNLFKIKYLSFYP
jgi:hypothetical protein